MATKRVFAFDFLRSVSILLVVLSHTLVLSNSGERTPANVYLGLVGNGVFFFLSGYLLQTSDQLRGSGGYLRRFFIKRATRIYPLYWLALAVFIVLEMSIYHSRFDLLTVSSHFLGLQIFLLPVYITEIYYYWFVSAIILFYLLYPLINYSNKLTLVCIISVLIFIFLY